MTRARVSIAMTTYNGAVHVGAQLESFAAQTRLPDQLVVCDDASSDETPDLVEAFATRAPFEVKLVRNAVNIETTPNFDQAVSMTDGDVVFLSDQDDVWHEDKVEAFLDVFESHPEIGCAFSNGRMIDGEGKPLGYQLWDSLWFDAEERRRVKEGDALAVFARHVVAAGTTLAFRGVYRSLALPLPDLHDCHDAWFCFLVTAVSGVRLIERDLIDYRLHGANQFGLQRFNLREQLEKARWQLQQGIFDHNIRFFGAVAERLGAQSDPRFRAPEAVFDLVAAKIAHARRRDAMTGTLWSRMPDIWTEIRNRGYWRFGYGVKSVAQDLLLR